MKKLTFSNCHFSTISPGTFKGIQLKKLVLRYSVFNKNAIQPGAFDFDTTDIKVVIYSRNDQTIILPSNTFGPSVSEVHISYGTLKDFSTLVFQDTTLKRAHFVGVTIYGQNESSQIQRTKMSLMTFNKTKIFASYNHPVINVSSAVTFVDSVLDFGKNSIIIEEANKIKFFMGKCFCQELCQKDIRICEVFKNVSQCKNDHDEYQPYGQYSADNCQMISTQGIIGISIGCLFLLVLIALIAIFIERFFKQRRMEKKLLDKFQVAYPATTIFK